MACMTPAADGTRLSIEDSEAAEFRSSVIEWLMVNHPHDCPVCDEGGECHLQDMTVMTGHTYREFRFDKRTHRNQYLGPFVNHEMNRCISCYRCVRFYRDYAGGDDLDVFGAHDHVYFGRHQDGVLGSEFSGNLVEVCPTGVFTDKTLKRHYTRKWDLQTAPSICTGCGLGCNTLPGERYGSLRRIRNRYHSQINGYFLCDRGRYGYEFVNSERRIRRPLLRQAPAAANNGQTDLEAATGDDALGQAATALATDKPVIGIGSPRASLEANYALLELVGREHFYLGLAESERDLLALTRDILQRSPARISSLREVETADAVLVLGEDVTNTAPLADLALRQAVRQQPMRRLGKLQIHLWDDHAVREAIQQETGPLYLATPYGTKLDEIATQTYRAAPDDLARLGFAVAHVLDPAAPAVEGLDAEQQSLAEAIAQALQQAERPLVVSGSGAGSPAVLQAAANVAWALHRNNEQARLFLTVPEPNSLGLALIGGGSLLDAFAALESDQAGTVVILENDLYRRADATRVEVALAVARQVIVLEHVQTRTSQGADMVLPAATFAEGDGTLVNNEGRAQRFFQVYVPDGEVQESWRWLRDLMIAAGRLPEDSWSGLDEVTAAMATALPQLERVPECAPSASFRLAGQKVPREPFRYSGRTAMHANVDVSEPKPPDDPDSALAFSMEGYGSQPPAALITRFWSPRWNSIQALNKFQDEVGGPLRGGDPGERLIQAPQGETTQYFTTVPDAFRAEEDRWLVVPVHHIFGSEELSMLTPGVAELAPEPYVALHPDDAARIQAEPGAQVRVSWGRAVANLPLRGMADLAQGLVGLPAGVLEQPVIPALKVVLKAA